jgi:Histidine kinase-, DNA gyrase B-, and HSP90-like ATPase
MPPSKKPATPPSPPPPPLRFNVAPHLVQDPGLNLYTNLPKVLVEFVANAYDADSPSVDIHMDFDDIEHQRGLVKLQVEKEKKAAAGKSAALAAIVPLAQRELPPTVTVKIIDRGCGMSRDDLATQFLIAGRRRREGDGGATTKTPGGRLLMGRKGVGKLAGFGVAHKVTITTRKKGEPHATRIVLDYDEIGKHRTTNDIVIPDQVITDGGGIPAGGGTEIVLSDLLHEPLRSHKQTIERALSDHFWLVAAAGFQIKLNGTPITSGGLVYRYAWPSPEVPADQLIGASIETEDKQSYTFRYRLRFREDSLKGRDRGVRVYAHGRLAAAPDLLDVPTGMHGFRQSDYLDGVVEADFIDDQPIDYIATDRQSLRWDTPLLSPLKKFLSDEMEKAIVAFQKVRDQKAEKEAEEDIFTNELINKAGLPKHRAKAVHKMAAALASICKGGARRARTTRTGWLS